MKNANLYGLLRKNVLRYEKKENPKNIEKTTKLVRTRLDQLKLLDCGQKLTRATFYNGIYPYL